jgi:hypothetical protein
VKLKIKNFRNEQIKNELELFFYFACWFLFVACSSKKNRITSFRDNLLSSFPFLQNQNKNKW